MMPTWFTQIRRTLHRQASILFLIVLFFVGMSLPIAAQQTPAPPTQTASNANAIDQQGRAHYEAAQYAEAVALWQQAIASFQSTGDRVQQAQTLSNLSLAYQQLGRWRQAEAAIQAALALLNSPDLSRSNQRLSLLAQAWDVQGRLQLSQGDAETAVTTWRQAAELYT